MNIPKKTYPIYPKKNQVGGFKHVLFSLWDNPSHWRTPSFFKMVMAPPTSFSLYPRLYMWHVTICNYIEIYKYNYESPGWLTTKFPTSYPNQACILPDELLWQIPSGKRGANRMAISPTWRGGTGGDHGTGKFLWHAGPQRDSTTVSIDGR